MVVNNKSKTKSHDEKIKNRKQFVVPLESGQCIDYLKKCAGWHNDVCEAILAHLVSHEANERWPVVRKSIRCELFEMPIGFFFSGVSIPKLLQRSFTLI